MVTRRQVVAFFKGFRDKTPSKSLGKNKNLTHQIKNVSPK
jgi:hypothetical protein